MKVYDRDLQTFHTGFHNPNANVCLPRVKVTVKTIIIIIIKSALSHRPKVIGHE